MALNRKIAHIDLKRKKINIHPIPLEWRRRFLGGRGTGAYLLSKYALPKCDPLGAENVIVISAGLLDGTLAAPLGCTSIMAKSPLTNLLSQLQLKGLFASEMRWAGFDHLVITHRAKQPVYLYIHNGRVEIRDAKIIWGENVSNTQELIRKDLRYQDVRILGIGPAGENLVRFATILTDQNTFSGRTGMGAVFGSKNIKAVVCRGTTDLEIKQPEEVLKFTRKIVGQVAGANKKDLSPKESLRLNLSIGEVVPTRLTESRFNLLTKYDSLIKELGMDTLAVTEILHWMFALIEKGIIRAKDTMVPKLSRDDSHAVRKMIYDIAFRKGYGDILAKGPFRAAGLIGDSSLEYFLPVKCLIKLYVEDPSEMNFSRDEENEMILNCLGISPDAHDDFHFDKYDFSWAIEQISYNTGLIFSDKELRKIAHRCYAIERLYNIRETMTCSSNFHPDCSFDVPLRLEMTNSQWDSIDLKTFKRMVGDYYRQRKWDKKTLFKAGVFKKLEIADLWSAAKR
ncbi:MAG: hypothetical protein KJO26_06985 [Deltaproteobacteria bacterium]|nr:hypothetical protein [Deltaproteobacteria bacterium]